MTWVTVIRCAAGLAVVIMANLLGYWRGYRAAQKVMVIDRFFEDRKTHFKRTLQQWDDMLKQTVGNDDRPN